MEYDGRRYYGFQWQSGLPTIQAELEKAIQKLTGEKRRVLAASRTDTGVHARGQMVSFRTTSTLSPQTVVRALNYYLPEDIAVSAAYRADVGLNVQRDAVSREYEYRILNSPIRSPLAEGFTYLVAGKLNIRIMNKGKRPWDIGCPHCNFNEWQKKVEEEKKNAPVKEEQVEVKEKKARVKEKKARIMKKNA